MLRLAESSGRIQIQSESVCRWIRPRGFIHRFVSRIPWWPQRYHARVINNFPVSSNAFLYIFFLETLKINNSCVSLYPTESTYELRDRWELIMKYWGKGLKREFSHTWYFSLKKYLSLYKANFQANLSPIVYDTHAIQVLPWKFCTLSARNSNEKASRLETCSRMFLTHSLWDIKRIKNASKNMILAIVSSPKIVDVIAGFRQFLV